MLKKFASILLIGLYSFTTSELHQLFKLPSLVQHYFEHKISEKQVTIIDFLLEHYADNKMDESQHQDLPFKSHDNCQSHNIVVYPPKEIDLINVPNQIIENRLFYFQTIFNSSSPISSIWQPPKNLV